MVNSLLLLPLMLGCVRTHKFFITPDYSSTHAPAGELVRLEYESGWRDESLGLFEAIELEQGGQTVYSPPAITNAGEITISPLVDDVELSLWIRHTTYDEGDFFQVKSVTGGIHKGLANELRWIPVRLSDAFTLPIHQLRNVYNDYDLRNGDLLMVQVDKPGSQAEQYVFRSEYFGLRSKFSAGLLVRTPVPFIDDGEGEFSPALALTGAFGYRARTRQPTLRWFSTRISLVLSAGIGSTEVALPSNDDELAGVFNAALVGGGVEFYDFLSLQLMGNVSALGRTREESSYALSVGFDAVRFGRFTADATTRLLFKNEL